MQSVRFVESGQGKKKRRSIITALKSIECVVMV